MKNIYFLLLSSTIVLGQNFDPITGQKLHQTFDPITGQKLQNTPLNDSVTGKKLQDCYQDGVLAAQYDYGDKGMFPGIGCGLFGLIGWGVGYLVYAMKDPDMNYYYIKDLDGNCKYDFERGYKSEGKKIRNKNFNTAAGVTAGVWILVNLSTI